MGPVNRPLDFVWLHEFLELVESGNFSRAAEALSIAQPALSRHMRSLEEWVGAELLDRSRHPVGLTPAGAVFNDAARDISMRLMQARLSAQDAQGTASSALRFAATHVLSLVFFPQWLQQVERGLQHGPIHMVSDSFHACEELMLQGRAQFLLAYGAPAVETKLQTSGFVYAVIGHDQLVPVSACADGKPLHAITQKASKQPLAILAYSEQSGLGQIMAHHLRLQKQADRFQATITSHHAALLKTLAMEGRGIAWLPANLVASEMADGRLVAAAGADWIVPMEIRLYRGANALGKQGEALWKLVQGA